MASIGTIATLNHLFFAHLESFRRERLLVYGTPAGEVVYSSQRFADAVFGLSRQLRRCKLAPGDRVAIFVENRPEWHVADFAILLARQVVVPVYATLSAPQVEYLLRHSGCRAAVIGGRRQYEVLAPLRGKLPELELVIAMEETEGVDTSLPRLEAEPPVSAAERAALRAEALAVEPGTLATIIYTSGTTGVPKGAMLSHANLVFDLLRSKQRIPSGYAGQALCALPLAHVLERLMAYGYFLEGMPIAYGDPHDLKALLKRHQPEVMACVPRILEKIREAVEEQMAPLPAWRQAAGRRLIRAAMARARQAATGRRAGFLDRLLAPLAGPLVFRKLRRQLGRLKGFVCGGAWLDPEVELFFRAAGYDLLQGYGMTETSPVIALNPYRGGRLGSVGPALEGTEIRISEEGEVLVRGPQVMLGYYGDPEATRAVLREGWLATGDLGRLDEQGFLTITGRRKEILVLSNGKNVACAAVEQALERSPYIQQAFAVGQGRKFVAALVVPRMTAVARAAAQRGLPLRNHADLAQPALATLFGGELLARQTDLSPFEQAKRFCFLNEAALLDPELVTPTEKIRRAVLEQKYAAWIARLYAQEEPFVIPPPGGLPEEVETRRP